MTKELDPEWVKLLTLARDSGFTVEELQQALKQLHDYGKLKIRKEEQKRIKRFYKGTKK